jgi:hypothetical protein
MNKITDSSTGGTIQLTNTGLIHKAGSGAYSGRVAELGIECKVVDQVKRGRGRPKLVTSTNGFYDFSAFMTTVKLPKWKGNSRIVLRNEK